MTSGAYIDGDYRYSLYRRWDTTKPNALWVMLNPSTADHSTDDPTIRRCIAFSKSWGMGSIEVVNLFALRAADPKELRGHPDPVGPDNDWCLSDAVTNPPPTCVVAAWGTRGALFHRDRKVLRLLDHFCPVQCLGTTNAGHPRHPLYVRADTSLVHYEPDQGAA